LLQTLITSIQSGGGHHQEELVLAKRFASHSQHRKPLFVAAAGKDGPDVQECVWRSAGHHIPLRQRLQRLSPTPVSQLIIAIFKRYRIELDLTDRITDFLNLKIIDLSIIA